MVMVMVMMKDAVGSSPRFWPACRFKEGKNLEREGWAGELEKTNPPDQTALQTMMMMMMMMKSVFFSRVLEYPLSTILIRLSYSFLLGEVWLSLWDANCAFGKSVCVYEPFFSAF